MPHCTPEQLALAALREPLPADDATHLASCERCRAEVASLQRAVDAVAVPELAAPGASVPPPPGVWTAIAAATGVSAAPPSVAAPSLTPAPPVAAGPPPSTGGEVLPFRARRPRFLLVAAAVAAGAVVGAGAVAVLQGGDDDGDPVTTVALEPLADSNARGRAEVVVRDDGSRVLEVELDAPALDDRFYEVWLLEESVEGMVTLGVAQAGTTTFELPSGLDLGEFPLVDVSVERLDGDPTHSGMSVARGELET